LFRGLGFWCYGFKVWVILIEFFVVRGFRFCFHAFDRPHPLQSPAILHELPSAAPSGAYMFKPLQKYTGGRREARTRSNCYKNTLREGAKRAHVQTVTKIQWTKA